MRALLAVLLTCVGTLTHAAERPTMYVSWNLVGAEKEQSEVYLRQAFQKAHLPVALVETTDADNTLRLVVLPTLETCSASLLELAISNGLAALKSTTCRGASVTATLVHGGEIVWTYAVIKHGNNLATTLANDVTKHLKQYLKKRDNK